jgi:glutathione S-transferase
MFAKAPADPEKMKKIEEGFQFLDKFLENHDFVAGSNLTIADLSLICTVSTAEVILPCEKVFFFGRLISDPSRKGRGICK